MSAKFGEGGVVQLAIQRHVVLNLLAGVQAVQDVTLQVSVDGVALIQAVQRDPMKLQLLSDVLTEKKKEKRGRGLNVVCVMLTTLQSEIIRRYIALFIC